VHHNDALGTIAVRMRVFLGRTPVRRPARMPDAVVSVERIQANAFFEIAKLALGAAQRQIVILIYNGNARRIVTAVFEFPQAIDNERHNLFVSNISDNSTHNFLVNFKSIDKFAARQSELIV
jgi:hypothetical protein